MSNNKYSLLRNEIGAYMNVLGEKDCRVVLVNADLSGTCRNTDFIQKFPGRSFNVGIAEQNMVSFAAGLAHEGFLPYAFSMAPFISMRACEQCRTDIAYAKVPVRLMGTYAGLSGGISGATHWAIEDCAIMTSMPNMMVLEPCDTIQSQKMMDITLETEGPIYIRSTIKPVPDIYTIDFPFYIGGSAIVNQGTDGAILCSGVIVQYALEAANIINKEKGANIRVVDMYSIKPIDRSAVLSASKTGNVLVAQDHNIVGGLGTAAATIIAEAGVRTKFKILGITDQFVPMAHADYLYHIFELDAEGLYRNMSHMLDRKEF